jgi:cytochrome-b5 reductase
MFMPENEIISPYKLVAIKPITHDTKQFTFSIPSSVNFAMLAGDFIKVFPDHSDELEYRTYTPTTTPKTRDHFELIIKRYPNGQVSRFMHDLKIGDDIWISGPHDGGHFKKGMATRVGMIAGGSGITPMISIIRTILQEGIDADISLIFSNKNIEDIILKDEFDSYETQYSNFKRFYVIDQARPGWTMGVGRINEAIMNEHLPEPSDETVLFICGPPMMQIELRKKLIEMGHKKEKIIIP